MTIHDDLLKSAAASNGRTFSASFSCTITAYFVVCALLGVSVLVQVFFVHIPLMFPDGTTVALGDIPYLHRPAADPAFDAGGAELYSFEQLVYASDLLVALVPIAVLSSMLLGLVWGLRSLSQLGLPIFVVIIAAMQLVKAVYFSLYYFSAAGFVCAQFAYCQNRNIAEAPSTPDSLFVLELFFTYGHTIAVAFMLSVASAYKAAQRSALSIGSHYAIAGAKRSDTPLNELRVDLIGKPVTPKTTKRTKKTRHIGAAVPDDTTVAYEAAPPAPVPRIKFQQH